ncbi:MAG: SDR family NAD(P)-dependent oxidoreductase, partial [Sphingomonas sp.]
MTSIILTGSSRGIGAAIAASFAQDDVTLAGHGTTSGIAVDFDQPGAASRLWAAALSQLGGTVDVLVNNAGVFEANPIDVDDAAWLASWERTMRINLTV